MTPSTINSYTDMLVSTRNAPKPEPCDQEPMEAEFMDLYSQGQPSLDSSMSSSPNLLLQKAPLLEPATTSKGLEEEEKDQLVRSVQNLRLSESPGQLFSRVTDWIDQHACRLRRRHSDSGSIGRPIVHRPYLAKGPWPGNVARCFAVDSASDDDLMEAEGREVKDREIENAEDKSYYGDDEMEYTKLKCPLSSDHIPSR